MSTVECNKKTLLVVGIIDVGNIARSIKASGYTAYTIDLFGDLDVKRYSDRSYSIKDYTSQIKKNLSLPQQLLEITKKLTSEKDIDGILLASGLDDENDILKNLNDLVPIIGNPPEVIQHVRDKMKFFNELKSLKIYYPETHLVSDFDEGLSAAKDIGYPVIIKPTSGFGGKEVRKIEDSTDLKIFFKEYFNKKWLLQEYVPGIPGSISFLANSSFSKILTLNEQLLGLIEFGQMEKFAYCGNIVPLDIPSNIMRECEDYTAKLSVRFSLKGSNGLDIIIPEKGEEIRVVELNPRFQGSMECVEKHLNLNLVTEHLNACLHNKLPPVIRNSESKYFARAILFARSQFTIPDLTSYPFIRDIPEPGCEISQGDPICSIFVDSTTRDCCLYEARRCAEMIYSLGI